MNTKKSKYPESLKIEIAQQYKKDVMGYKKLARLYGIPRDTIRDWVQNPLFRKDPCDADK